MKKSDVLNKVIHLLCLLPLVLVFGSAVATLLGFSSTLGFVASTAPLDNVAMAVFTAMLAVTPVTILTGWQWVQPVKRTLALYAFSYSMIHFVIFSGAFGFMPAAVVAGAFGNAMLAAGSIALLGMVPLALTSNRFAMRTMKRNWKRLHYLTYGIAVFIIAHLFFLGVAFPWAVLFTVLLGMRIPPIRRAIVNTRKKMVSGWQKWGRAVPQPQMAHAQMSEAQS